MLHTPPQTPPPTHHTIHSTHHTPHSTHYTPHSTPHSTHYIPHTTHHTLHTTQYTAHTTHHTPHTTHHTQKIIFNVSLFSDNFLLVKLTNCVCFCVDYTVNNIHVSVSFALFVHFCMRVSTGFYVCLALLGALSFATPDDSSW